MYVDYFFNCLPVYKIYCNLFKEVVRYNVYHNRVSCLFISFTSRMDTMDNDQPQEEMTFEEMMGEDLPHQTFLDDDFTCVSESETTLSSKVGGFNKKNKKDRKSDKVIKYVQNRKVIIEMFSTSDTTGAPIRSATDGIIYTPLRVGSLGENLFFKVRNTTSKDGVKSYYYSTPEEYERHTLNTVTDDIKKTWSDKYAYTDSILKPKM